MEALDAGADAIAAGSARVALVVVSDALRPGLGTGFEARCGAGAAAVVLAREGGTASLGTRVSHSRPLVDRYRGDGEIDNRDLYDARLFREEIFLPERRRGRARAARPTTSRAWSLPDPDGRLGAVVAKKAGARRPRRPPTVYAQLGDTGAAAALLGAIGAIVEARCRRDRRHRRRPHDRRARRRRSSGCRAPSGVAAVLAGGRPASYPEVLRSRGQLVPGGETIPMGVPPESALFARGADEMLGLLGGRCVDCGTISTPPSIHPTCISCGGPKLEPVQLARGGTVHTYVINHTMPAPFVAPLPIAVLDMDDGARLMLQVVGDGNDVEIGRSVRLVLRKYAHERGVPVYGFKARPARAEEK